jgi:hypothetical protein
MRMGHLAEVLKYPFVQAKQSKSCLGHRGNPLLLKASLVQVRPRPIRIPDSLVFGGWGRGEWGTGNPKPFEVTVILD